MVSAVVFVSTFQSPPAGSAPTRTILERQSDDALAILYDTQLAGQTDALSQYILECLQGDCSNLTRKLDKLLPSEANYAVYLSNGAATWPVHETREPSGEAVTSRRLIEPAWSHTFVGVGTGLVNPSKDALVIYAVPIHKSNPVSPGGSPLLVRVHGTRVGDGAEYVLTTAYATQAAGVADVTKTPAASFYFANATGAPLASTDVRATTVVGSSPTLDNVTFRLRLQESAGVAIPINSTLAVRIPAGWHASADPAANAADWAITSNATDYNASFDGSTIHARLTHPVNATSVDFTFNAIYRGAKVDYYPFQASMARGIASTASLLVRADTHGTQPELETAGIQMSVPRPMGATATTTWALSAFAPEGSNLSNSDAVDITRIEIIEDDGVPIFGGAATLSGPGAWVANGSRLEWSGAHRLQHSSPLNLTFTVTASGVGGDSEIHPEFVAPVVFDGWTGRILSKAGPALYKGTFLPATGSSRGYNGTSGATLYAQHAYQTVGVFRTTALPGNGTYASGYFSAIDDSTGGSYVDFASRNVPLGGTMSLDLRAQSTLYTLASLGLNPTITMNIHPPWATDPTRPIHSEVLYDGSALGPGGFMTLLDTDSDGKPGPGSFGTFNATKKIPANWLFGTYVVEVELNWTESISALIGNTTLSEVVARSTHFYDYFVVTPPDGLRPASPVYDVHLVTWFDDWR